MKRYRIKVNGKTYNVELEAIDEVASSSPAPVAERKEEAKPAPAAKAASEGGTKLPSPIQGQIIAVKKNVGDSVKKGEVVFIIEAMKLENEVVAPCDGVIKEILVSKGTSVTAKQDLAVIG